MQNIKYCGFMLLFAEVIIYDDDIHDYKEGMIRMAKPAKLQIGGVTIQFQHEMGVWLYYSVSGRLTANIRDALNHVCSQRPTCTWDTRRGVIKVSGVGTEEFFDEMRRYKGSQEHLENSLSGGASAMSDDQQGR